MRRFGDIIFGFIIGFFFLTASVQMWGQEVHWGTGTANDPYVVDADGDGKHVWGATQYGENNKTIYYKLRGNCTISNKFKVTAGTVVFDLNGFALKTKEQSADNSYSLFEVFSPATLVIKSSNAGGAIVGIDGSVEGNGDKYTPSAAIYVNGTLNFESGAIKNFRRAAKDDEHQSGCALYIEGGTVNMTGGTIENCGFDRREHYGTGTSGTYTKENVKHYGGAAYIVAGGKLNMSGGAISNCGAYSGGAVYLGFYSDKTLNCGVSEFNMSGGKIEQCEASYRGGAVYVGSDADYGKNKFTVSGNAVISGCKAGLGGNGVCVFGDAVMMGNSVIEGNIPLAEYVKEDGSELPNYAVEQITATNFANGGGVFVKGIKDNDSRRGSFVMQDNAVIRNNIASSGGGIMADGDCDVTINVIGDALTGNHAIGAYGTGNGGAIYAQKCKFEFKQGILRGNYARRYGGGININDNAVLFLGGDEGICKVEGNFAGHGGGISQEAGECRISINKSNVHIIGNKARGIKQNESQYGSYGDWGVGGNGGGLFIEKGTLDISTGSIEHNCAGGDGGGISLRNQRIAGNITLNISGDARICNNNDKEAEPGNGGGIDIYATKDDSKVTANILSGVISGNKSADGAGINIYVSTEASGSSASLRIGDGSGTPEIKSNTASGVGGGVTLENGTITINKGKIEENVALNGGGICLKTGSITVTDGFIQNNVANNNGGGLYVVNTGEGAAKKTVAFTGGTFAGNKALNGGGGICVHGNIELTATGTTVNLNTAKKGGGIYLLGEGSNAASMKYKGGLITNNTATGDSQGKTTADGDDAANSGVGGGVYLAEGTSLVFEVDASTPFGLYGNSANFAADDIFANSTGTKLVLPNVSSMQLDGFKAPTTELYWVEDYANSDTGYESGKVIVGGANPVYRYQEALRSMANIVKVPFETSQATRTFENKYICVALGYDLYYVSLVKKGLEVGESAVFDVYYQKNSTWEKYRTVLFPCVNPAQAGVGEGAGVMTTVLLPAGVWKFVENANWSWKYSLSDVVKDVNDTDVTKAVISGSGVSINDATYTDEIKQKGGFKYIFTNSSKETDSNKLPASDEAVVVNKMKKN